MSPLSLKIKGNCAKKPNRDPETAASDNDGRTYVIDHLHLGAVENELGSDPN